MKKASRYLLYGLSALVLASGALLAYIAVTVDPNDYKPQIVDLVKEETDRTLILEGSIGLKLFPRIALNLGRAELSGSGGQGKFASVNNAVLDLAWLPLLQGRMSIEKIDIEGLRVSLVRYRDGKTNYDDLASGKGGGKKAEFDIGGIEVKNSSVSYADEKTGRKTALEGIVLKTGRLAEGVHTDISLGFDMKDGNSESRMDLKSGLLMEPQRYRLDGMALKYRAGKLDADLKGNAEIDMKQQTVSADVAANFDDSHVKAKLGMSNFSSPAYRFRVSLDRLDADRYLSGSKDGGKEKPIDLSFLKKLNAQGSLSIGSVKVDGLKLSNFELGVKASDSRLDLDPLSADLYQGKTSGSAVVEALAVPRFTFRQNLSGISIGPLVKDMTQKDIIEGKGNVTADLSATGDLVSGLKKSLGGRVSLRLTDGAVRGIDLAATLRGIQSKIGGAQTGTANAAEKTDFSELSATFDIRNGVARNSDLSAKSPLLRLGGEGNIDIGRSAVDYLARVSVVSTLQGQGGADLASLKGVTIPVHVSGPFDSLHYSLDLHALASSALKSKVEQKKIEIRNKMQDELMKGIFGR